MNTKKYISLELAKEISEVAKERKINLPESEYIWTYSPTVFVRYGSPAPKDKMSYLLLLKEYSLDRFNTHKDSPDYSAYDTFELGEILPMEVAKDCGTWDLTIERNSVSGVWGIGYCSLGGKQPDIEAKTEPEARGKMLLYLLKNDLLK